VLSPITIVVVEFTIDTIALRHRLSRCVIGPVLCYTCAEPTTTLTVVEHGCVCVLAQMEFKEVEETSF